MTATILGYPRIGPDRELKRATEAYWAGRIDARELAGRGAVIRRANWETMLALGLTEAPCNDFSYYDQMLDTTQLVGVVPPGLDAYFAAARGSDDTTPLEMTKWFDTNYHYLVPELGARTTFRLNASKPVAELAEARSLGVPARPVVIGPVTFLALAKPAPGEVIDPVRLLDRLVPVYAELLRELDAEWVQFDEPILVTDLDAAEMANVARTYDALGSVSRRPRIMVATYFGPLGDALPVLREAPVDGVAIDLTARGGDNLARLRAVGGLPGKRLVAGIVDGRNVWANDLRASLRVLESARDLADELVVSSSSSLLHVPLDVRRESDVPPWLAFARQKVDEVVTLARGLAGADISGELSERDAVLAARATWPPARNDAVRARNGSAPNRTPYRERRAVQQRRLGLPTLPTTTIGSFPQTERLRRARRDLRTGAITAAGYHDLLADEIARVVRLQEDIGLDVLVHGEPERNDMVQYFAEQLDGFLATTHGWVQSYGSRYVRPPILAGDVRRRAPLTVEWTSYAGSLTDRPVKGILTGPVTMLAWSFVRDDLPASDVARQVALALRDEVADLEAAGIAIIQVDEPALREMLPLRRADRPDYLAWAVTAFRLATSGVRDETQIHTHMCYAEFGEILDAVAALDVDVISLEAARSHMSIADELADAGYAAAVGPGVYDIHAPHVPTAAEIEKLIERALARLEPEQLWINPDCGLKTRTEEQVREALTNMVQAASAVRARY